jgi:8-oxo-dGTP pyrophosphatase MutT (NUDIX family)
LNRAELETRLLPQISSPYGQFPEGTESCRPAAVLVPFIERQNGTTLLLTRRSEQLKDHPGQVCFPGGGVDQVDLNPADTAVRETCEELGIAPNEIEVMGTLSTLVTGTGFCITPVLGFVSNESVWMPQVQEVEEVFEIPLDFLFDENNHSTMMHEYKGKQYTFWSMPYGDKFVWGATAQIIRWVYELVQ